MALALDLIARNPRLYPHGASLFSRLIDMRNVDEEVWLDRIKNRMRSVLNTEMLDLWIQRLLISRNKKSSYVKRLCYHCPTRSKKDAYRLWNVDWLNSDARKIVEETPIVNVEVVSSLKRVIDPEELSLFDEYDGY